MHPFQAISTLDGSMQQGGEQKGGAVRLKHAEERCML